jgi:hypothetical protein
VREVVKNIILTIQTSALGATNDLGLGHCHHGNAVGIDHISVPLALLRVKKSLSIAKISASRATSSNRAEQPEGFAQVVGGPT